MEMIQMAKRQRSESVENPTTNLSSLNDDCLLNLLNYFELNELCTVGRVCKKLQQLVDMLFVTRFQYKIQSEVQITATFDRRIVIQPNDQYVKYFLKYMKRLRICDVYDELPFTTVVEFIRKKCNEQFDTIIFERINFHELHGAMLGDWLANVEELAFFSCKNLHKILERCNNFKFLKIDQYSKDHSNKWMTKRYPSLQHLECDIIGLNKQFLNFLTNSSVKSLMIKLGHIVQQVTLNHKQFLGQLCQLQLEQLMITFDNARDLYSVKNQLKAICDGPQFKRLDMCLNMQELGFVFSQELKNLIGLHICSLLPTNIILEHVKVLQLTSVSVRNDLWQNLPNLEELYLSSTWKFQTLVKPFVRHAIKLKKIVARDFKITNRLETSNENLARHFNDQRVLLVDTFNTRRQLTPVQQTHILSDVQQHQQQHRFAFPQNHVVDNQQSKNFGQKSPNVFIESSVFQQLPTQTTILNQKPPPFQSNQPQYRFPQSSVRLNPQQSQNNFRTAPAPNGRSNNFNNEIHVQHHTQTNFIPNFSQQQPTVEQTRSSSVQFPQPTFERNQLNAPQPHQVPNPQLHQQPLNQRSIPNGQNNFQVPQKPFQPSIQLPSPGEPLLSTPNVPQQNPLQPVATLQSQLFNPQQQFSFNPEPQTQILQIQPSKQITNQFIQNHQGQQQFSTFPQQQQTFVQQPQPQFIQPQPQFVQQGPPQFFREEDRIKQIREKQQIIQKHEQFVAKQYQKQQNKVKQQHEEFLAKQRQIKEHSIALNRPTNVEYSQQITRSRAVHPYESGTFERAVKVYHETHPTSPKPTTTTPSTTNGASNKKRKQVKSEISDDDLEEFLKNHRQKLYSDLKQEVESGKAAKSGKSKVKSTKALGRDDLLKQLKLALADAPQDLGNSTYSSMDVVLPDGQKVQVIRTSDPSLIQGATPLNGANEFLGQPERLVSSPTTPQPDVINHEELLKGFSLPPGANFEVIKQGSDGVLKEVGNLPPQKKVTFVYLEEQNDGSYKVQGVKANGDKEAKTKGAEVDSIVKRIKNGEIQLPPPSNRVGLSTIAVTSTTTSPNSPVNVIPLSTVYETNTAAYSSSSSSTPSPTVHFRSSVSPYSTLATINSEETIRLTASPSSHFPSSASPSSHFLSSASPSSHFPSSTPSTLSTFQSTFGSSSSSFPSSVSTYETSASASINSVTPSYETSQESTARFHLPTESTDTQTDSDTNNELSSILKSRGLHAMAKYLKQSGLDSILNETGPYTVFVPTDKAFKSLLVQLGGPERAEEKFKTNPRLLSGLLLHHVIPGSFEIASLQDEMTGVSLAGTQLRVNQYNMHDAEWNDIKITTINGAMIVPDKNDITIPQGIAHAVDRVMFPLPVGDILQTLQSDREHLFTIFLKALFSSGISEILQNKDLGAKTYSVFAPIDAAFSNQTQDEISIMVNDKETATKLVMKHVTPGTLFSAGMRFYQVKDSLTGGKPITLQKTSGGKIKVNESQIITSNIPAINGVIHAIDSLL